MISLKNLLNIVEGYEIEIKEDAKGNNERFNCIWKASNLHFDIDFGWKSSGVFRDVSAEDSQTIFVMELSEDAPIEMDVIESFGVSNGHLIIFDPEEDIQMFSKDFWNLIVFLNDSKGENK